MQSWPRLLELKGLSGLQTCIFWHSLIWFIGGDHLQPGHLFALEKLPLRVVTVEPGGPIDVNCHKSRHSRQM